MQAAFGILASFANLRDLGGLSAGADMRVRSGLVYRSAMLACDEPEVLAELTALGIRSIIDLRSNGERDLYPTPWTAMGCSDYWFRDHIHDSANLVVGMGERMNQPGAARARMVALYRDMPFAQCEGYREIFLRLAEQHTPLLFHCAAGKDRTGVAAALLLATLDVPLDVILQDYVQTNRFDLDAKFKSHKIFALASPETLSVVMGAHPEYIHAAIAAVVEKAGSVVGYLRSELGLGTAQIDRIKTHLLEKRV